MTLLRSCRILGKGSLSGNLPKHNRDPLLVEKIESGETLMLYNNGNVPFNYIHQRDIAQIVLRVSLEGGMKGKARFDYCVW